MWSRMRLGRPAVTDTGFDKDPRGQICRYLSMTKSCLHCENFAYFHGHEVGGPSLLEAQHHKLNLLLDVGFNREVGEDGPFIGKRWVGTRHWGSRGFDQVVIADLDFSQAKELFSFHMEKICQIIAMFKGQRMKRDFYTCMLAECMEQIRFYWN